MSEVAPWTRPEPVPFPCVRQRHVGRRPLEVAGGDAPPAYVVQELPGDRHEEAVRLMADVFLREEPITSCFGLRDDPEAFAELQEVWRLVLSERISLCALVEQPDGSPGPLAAFNMLMVVRPGEKFEVGGCTRQRRLQSKKREAGGSTEDGEGGGGAGAAGRVRALRRAGVPVGGGAGGGARAPRPGAGRAAAAGPLAAGPRPGAQGHRHHVHGGRVAAAGAPRRLPGAGRGGVRRPAAPRLPHHHQLAQHDLHGGRPGVSSTESAWLGNTRFFIFFICT
ncbi:uncharacterized protein LOC124595990 isoform X1 [Schistocerca americana]|uniref:uncharacterized protein LOC124595990 isoform X1 n=1 Tax=Schistocerca americana TaxID=7009 RepID=UPI001F4F96FF|nr:uncharacterized protein LOC124595990 isoform X1 [Schistocerca americana]